MNPNSNLPLDRLLRELRHSAAMPFEQARPIPAAVKHSGAFHDHEISRIFSQEWVCIGREDELDQPGSYLTHEIAGVPVFVVRQRSGKIAGFINACAHRHACLLQRESGRTKKITCRYHAWSYDLQGKLVSAPYMEMKADFTKSDHGLRPLRVDIWEGFVYTTLAENPATELDSALRSLRENVVGRFDMACYKTVLRKSMQWNSNWKNLIENFTESYHVPIAHRKTFAKHEKPLDKYVCGEDSDYYGYHRAPQQSETGPGAAHVNNRRLEGEWRRMMVDFCVFPCHLITLMPDFLWWISVQPQGVDRFKASWGVAIPPEILEEVAEEKYDNWIAEIENYMDVANNEDKELVEALQLGTASPALPPGTFHPVERNLWQFNRYLTRTCGAA